MQAVFKGKAFLLKEEDITCPIARATLGFVKFSEKVLVHWTQRFPSLKGSMIFALEHFRNAVKIKAGETYALALSPLHKAILGYDVVLFAINAEQAMWLLLAERYKQGGPSSLNLNAGFQGLCGDVTAYPHLSQKINLSVGGYPDRQKNKIGKNDLFIGIPGPRLEEITENLELLHRRPIVRVSRKDQQKGQKPSVRP